MAPCFLAAVRSPGHTEAGLFPRLAAAASPLGLAPVFEDGRLLVLATPSLRLTRIGETHGVVLGTLFQRDRVGGPYRVHDGVLDERAGRSGGDALLRSWWGAYVAFMSGAERGAIHVLRDPSGAMACYRCAIPGAHVFFSDVTVACALGLIDPRPDRVFAGHCLAYPDLRTARTGLIGVEEVLAGGRLSVQLEGGAASTTAWTPWAFAAADQQIRDRKQALEALRAETQRCVSAWASRTASIRLELSGGLDSSIVAACLKEQRAAIACVTLVTPDPGADERAYARSMAASIGAPLEEVLLDSAAGDVRAAPPMRSPRPGTGVLQQVLDTALSGQGAQVDAIFTGGGGDNLFCYLGTAAPAADVLLTHGPGSLFLETLDDLAVLHGCTAWRAGQMAIRKALRRPRPWRQDPLFLSNIALAPPDHHPWLDAPRGALPGKREHIAALMRIQNAPDGKARQAIAPIRYPLLSQPLVELCLTIPSWMWVTGGRNRALARDAFSGRLPELILERTTKGDFTGFLGAIYERQKPALADLLLGGWLAGEGLLDVVRIEAYLAASDPPRDVNFYRLLEIAGVEVWARSWLNVKPSAADA